MTRFIRMKTCVVFYDFLCPKSCFHYSPLQKVSLLEGHKGRSAHFLLVLFEGFQLAPQLVDLVIQTLDLSGCPPNMEILQRPANIGKTDTKHKKMRPSAVVQGLPSAAIPQRLLLTISKGWPWPDPRLLDSWAFPKMAVPQVTMGSILKNTKRVIQSSMTCMIWGSTGCPFWETPSWPLWSSGYPVAGSSGSHRFPAVPTFGRSLFKYATRVLSLPGPWTWSWLPGFLSNPSENHLGMGQNPGT